MAGAALELIEIWHSYSRRCRGRRALDGISLGVGRGEVLGIAGPNGSGKTTLLRIAGLLLRPCGGSVRVFGSPVVWREAWRLRGRVVYVPDRPVVLRGSTLHNIALGAELRGYRGSSAVEAARRVARMLGLEGLLGERASRLSMGQRHLVTIARALAAGPEVLLLDEPFAHLDLERREMLARSLRRLASQGLAVVVSSHDLYTLSAAADRVVYLVEGRVAFSGSPAVLAERLASWPPLGRG